MKKIIKIGSAILIISPIVIVASCGSKNIENSSEKNNNDKNNNSINDISTLKEKYNGYYSSLNTDSRGEKLFNELRDIQKKYRDGVGSYGKLWEIYKTAFIDEYDEKDNTIFDIYSEIVGKKDPYNFLPGTDQNRGKSGPEGSSYNREHIVPQSYFGKSSKYPIHNDAHFIFPTDSKVNANRGNRPFNVVSEVSSISKNGSKYGEDINGIQIFEPIDYFKGDVARAIFYFQLTWNDFHSNEHNENAFPILEQKFPYVKQPYLNIYKNWSLNDKLSQFDIDRNGKIAEAENGLRNPFVDMPELINLIWQ
ncbi:MAG: endonuclease [Mycoplasmatales bacterium]|nr:endonuclease [Mycoplasmatales bacterium]